MSGAGTRQGAMGRVVVVGGGTAGWIAAAVLSHALGPGGVRVTLVESEEIGTVGVGEATIPHIQALHALLGVDEDAFVRATGATFKLGIEFVGWSGPDARYTHPFGRFGQPLDGVAFHHHWLRHRAWCEARGQAVPPLADYSLMALAAGQGRFQRPVEAPNAPLGQITYAFHFDAVRYAAFLRAVAEVSGALRVEGRVVDAVLDGGTGHIRSVELADGRSVAGDLFVDCTGFAASLIGERLGAGYEDWSRWLPCDRAVAVQSAVDGPPEPRTRAKARRAGWQWRIPLQTRIGNGHVYSSAFESDEAACGTLLASLDGAPLAEPRVLRFTTGRRSSFWIGNCVALGLAAGFLEPLESTGIHLAQAGALRLAALFPRDRVDPAAAAAYNRITATEWERVRDFLIAHYHCTTRDDSPFWNHVRTMAVPDGLAEALELWRTGGQLIVRDGDLFGEANWLAVLEGQGVRGGSWHPAADAMEPAELDRRLARLRAVIAASAERMPPHQRFIDDHCRAAEPRAARTAERTPP